MVITQNANPVMTTTFDSKGNIQNKTGMGNYTIYDTPTHAPQSVGSFTGQANPLQEINYTPFNKIAQIKEGESTLTLDFEKINYTYGLDNERRKMVFEQTTAGILTASKTKYYSLNYEKEITTGNNTRELNYIVAPDGLAAIYEITNGAGKIYYTFADNLGSLNMIVNTDGTIASDMGYDAWGRRRNAKDWTYDNLSTSTITERGYTLHEHLDAFNLINMNGRAYDPLLGQFLSPDPFVQDPTNTQSYNRYAYCLNNPLKYTDPSGYGWVIEDGIPVWEDEITNADVAAEKGYTWVGDTYTHVNDDMSTTYGDQYGKAWDYAPLSAVEIIEGNPIKNSITYAIFGDLGLGGLDAGEYGSYNLDKLFNDISSFISSIDIGGIQVVGTESSSGELPRTTNNIWFTLKMKDFNEVMGPILLMPGDRKFKKPDAPSPEAMGNAIGEFLKTEKWDSIYWFEQNGYNNDTLRKYFGHAATVKESRLIYDYIHH